jgi:hypothetical protein
MQEGPGELGADQVFDIAARVKLEHLADLFGQRHPG